MIIVQMIKVKKFFLSKKNNSKFKYFKSKKKEKLGVARYNALKKLKVFFLFFDCDDYLLPSKLKHKLNFLKKNRSCLFKFLFFSKFRNRKIYGVDENNIKKLL